MSYDAGIAPRSASDIMAGLKSIGRAAAIDDEVDDTAAAHHHSTGPVDPPSPESVLMDIAPPGENTIYSENTPPPSSNVAPEPTMSPPPVNGGRSAPSAGYTLLDASTPTTVCNGEVCESSRPLLPPPPFQNKREDVPFYTVDTAVDVTEKSPLQQVGSHLPIRRGEYGGGNYMAGVVTTEVPSHPTLPIDSIDAAMMSHDIAYAARDISPSVVANSNAVWMDGYIAGMVSETDDNAGAIVGYIFGSNSPAYRQGFKAGYDVAANGQMSRWYDVAKQVYLDSLDMVYPPGSQPHDRWSRVWDDYWRQPVRAEADLLSFLGSFVSNRAASNKKAASWGKAMHALMGNWTPSDVKDLMAPEVYNHDPSAWLASVRERVPDVYDDTVDLSLRVPTPYATTYGPIATVEDINTATVTEAPPLAAVPIPTHYGETIDNGGTLAVDSEQNPNYLPQNDPVTPVNRTANSVFWICRVSRDTDVGTGSNVISGYSMIESGLSVASPGEVMTLLRSNNKGTYNGILTFETLADILGVDPTAPQTATNYTWVLFELLRLALTMPTSNNIVSDFLRGTKWLNQTTAMSLTYPAFVGVSSDTGVFPRGRMVGVTGNWNPSGSFANQEYGGYVYFINIASLVKDADAMALFAQALADPDWGVIGTRWLGVDAGSIGVIPGRGVRGPTSNWADDELVFLISAWFGPGFISGAQSYVNATHTAGGGSDDVHRSHVLDMFVNADRPYKRILVLAGNHPDNAVSTDWSYRPVGGAAAVGAKNAGFTIAADGTMAGGAWSDVINGDSYEFYTKANHVVYSFAPIVENNFWTGDPMIPLRVANTLVDMCDATDDYATAVGLLADAASYITLGQNNRTGVGAAYDWTLFGTPGTVAEEASNHHRGIRTAVGTARATSSTQSNRTGATPVIRVSIPEAKTITAFRMVGFFQRITPVATFSRVVPRSVPDLWRTWRVATMMRVQADFATSQLLSRPTMSNTSLSYEPTATAAINMNGFASRLRAAAYHAMWGSSPTVMRWSTGYKTGRYVPLSEFSSITWWDTTERPQAMWDQVILANRTSPIVTDRLFDFPGVVRLLRGEPLSHLEGVENVSKLADAVPYGASVVSARNATVLSEVGIFISRDGTVRPGNLMFDGFSRGVFADSAFFWWLLHHATIGTKVTKPWAYCQGALTGAVNGTGSDYWSWTGGPTRGPIAGVTEGVYILGATGAYTTSLYFGTQRALGQFRKVTTSNLQSWVGRPRPMVVPNLTIAPFTMGDFITADNNPFATMADFLVATDGPVAPGAAPVPVDEEPAGEPAEAPAPVP